MQAGDFAAACPKLEASQRLDPGVGTLLNLSELPRAKRSHGERVEPVSRGGGGGGQRQSARARRRSRGAASATSNRKLCRLRVTSVRRDDRPTVRRDGVPVDPALWDEPVPIDPGRHEVTAAAPGRRPGPRPWSSMRRARGPGRRGGGAGARGRALGAPARGELAVASRDPDADDALGASTRARSRVRGRSRRRNGRRHLPGARCELALLGRQEDVLSAASRVHQPGGQRRTARGRRHGHVRRGWGPGCDGGRTVADRAESCGSRWCLQLARRPWQARR